MYCVQGVSEKQCTVYKVSLKSSVLCTRCLWKAGTRCLWKAVYCVQGVSKKQCTVYKVSLKISVLCTRCIWKKCVYCLGFLAHEISFKCVKKCFSEVQYSLMRVSSMKHFSLKCRFNFQKRNWYSKMCSASFQRFKKRFKLWIYFYVLFDMSRKNCTFSMIEC